MNDVMISGMRDEIQKMAFDAATAMEAIGIPAAMYMGYRKGGLKGAATTGIGAAGGLGAGMAGAHYINKLISPAWESKHPLLATIARAAPIGMGGVLGGAVGEHYAGHGHPKVAAMKVKLSGPLMSLLSRTNPVIATDTINDVGKIPYRFKKYLKMMETDPYVQPPTVHQEGVSASSEMSEPTRGISDIIHGIESIPGRLKRAL